jgi:hypothetical protein
VLLNARELLLICSPSALIGADHKAGNARLLETMPSGYKQAYS